MIAQIFWLTGVAVLWVVAMAISAAGMNGTALWVTLAIETLVFAGLAVWILIQTRSDSDPRHRL